MSESSIIIFALVSFQDGAIIPICSTVSVTFLLAVVECLTVKQRGVTVCGPCLEDKATGMVTLCVQLRNGERQMSVLSSLLLCEQSKVPACKSEPPTFRMSVLISVNLT